MRKRALAATRDSRLDDPMEPLQSEASQQLRRMLLDRFTMGSMSGADVAEICHWVTEAGAKGVSELGLKPEQATKHGHEHVRRHAGKIFPEPNLTYIETPLYVKKEARRVREAVPVMLPSTLFRDYVEKPEVLAKSEANFALVKDLPAYVNHPVVKEASGQGLQVRPIALSWDGVQ